MPIVSGSSPDPHLRPWMLFVDGENFTIRGQNVMSNAKTQTPDSDYWRKNAFLWFQGLDSSLLASQVFSMAMREPESGGLFPNLQQRPERAYYYASTRGDERDRDAVTKALWDLGFTPKVFKRPADDSRKSKAVDIAFATDVLTHAFYGHYDVAVLVAGDEDYVPLVDEVKRQGRRVVVAFFTGEESGLSQRLRLAADTFLDLTDVMLTRLRIGR
jgi:NYN domain